MHLIQRDQGPEHLFLPLYRFPPRFHLLNAAFGHRDLVQLLSEGRIHLMKFHPSGINSLGVGTLAKSFEDGPNLRDLDDDRTDGGEDVIVRKLSHTFGEFGVGLTFGEFGIGFR